MCPYCIVWDELHNIGQKQPIGSLSRTNSRNSQQRNSQRNGEKEELSKNCQILSCKWVSTWYNLWGALTSLTCIPASLTECLHSLIGLARYYIGLAASNSACSSLLCLSMPSDIEQPNGVRHLRTLLKKAKCSELFAVIRSSKRTLSWSTPGLSMKYGS